MCFFVVPVQPRYAVTEVPKVSTARGLCSAAAVPRPTRLQLC